MKRFRIDVNEGDIANGCRSAPGSCPVARAVLRTFDKARAVQVDQESIDIYSGVYGEYARFRTPPSIASWITRFDDGKKVRPTSFDIMWPA